MDEDLHKRIFETERYLVRTFGPTDGEDFFSLMGDPQVMQYIRPPKSREDSDLFLEEVIKFSVDHPLLGRWAVEERSTGVFVGSFAIIPVPGEEDKIQLGYSMLPGFWGKGIATELTRSGLKYFLTHFEGTDIYGITEIPNTASQHVLLKAGFKEFGTKMEDEKELLVFVYKSLANVRSPYSCGE